MVDEVTTNALRWTVEQAQEWYKKQGWRQGVNYIPSTCVNSIDMWQGTLDQEQIQKELTWAANLGYNALRVFLHDLVWHVEGPDPFFTKIDQFLTLADSFHMQTMLVIFEGIWDPDPKYDAVTAASKGETVLSGKGQDGTTIKPSQQLSPRPFVHNSRWVQSPGRDILLNETMHELYLKPYVQSIIRRFGNDSRVLMLDLFDQPENGNDYSYGNLGDRVPSCEDAKNKEMHPLTKADIIRDLIPNLFQWAREVGPIQVPVTIAAWTTIDDPDDRLEASMLQYQLRKYYLQESDILTFHHYQSPNDLLKVLTDIQLDHPGRPVVLSSFMARESNSTLNPILGLLEERNVWAMNWGLVSGKIQTIYNATSWNVPFTSPPQLWHHDILWPNGSAYSSSEQNYLQSHYETTQLYHRSWKPSFLTCCKVSVSWSWDSVLPYFAGLFLLIAFGLLSFHYGNPLRTVQRQFAPVQQRENEEDQYSDDHIINDDVDEEPHLNGEQSDNDIDDFMNGHIELSKFSID